MSAAKSDDEVRETRRRGGPDRRDGSRGGRVGTTVVTARLSSEVVAMLDALRADLGCSRAAAVEHCVRWATTGERALQAPVTTVIDVPASVVADVAARADAAVEAYNRLSLQVQAVGRNVNQMARLANAGEVIDPDAFGAVVEAMDDLRLAMDRVTRADAALAEGSVWLSS